MKIKVYVALITFQGLLSHNCSSQCKFNHIFDKEQLNSHISKNSDKICINWRGKKNFKYRYKYICHSFHYLKIRSDFFLQIQTFLNSYFYGLLKLEIEESLKAQTLTVSQNLFYSHMLNILGEVVQILNVLQTKVCSSLKLKDRAKESWEWALEKDA